MYRKNLIILAIFLVVAVFFIAFRILSPEKFTETINNLDTNQSNDGGPGQDLHPLTIDSLRKGDYPGSDITIEQTLSPGSNYQRYIASYKSEGLKIYALLTIPNGEKPTGGWPVIVFNHGYIPPAEYQTTERYIPYMDAFSASGYIVIKPDYRGHGNSEGQPTGAYGSTAYTIDVLNAQASIKKYKDSDSSRIGMWGHSLGGFLTLRSMVVSKDVKAGVIWAGVVGSYPDMINNWRRTTFSPPPDIPQSARRWRQELVEKYGSPEQNPEFWDSISANSFLSDISGPLQLHHGTADVSVPIEFSEKLNDQMKTAGKESAFYKYEGDDHNISANLSLALSRSVEFFDRHLK